MLLVARKLAFANSRAVPRILAVRGLKKYSPGWEIPPHTYRKPLLLELLA